MPASVRESFLNVENVKTLVKPVTGYILVICSLLINVSAYFNLINVQVWFAYFCVLLIIAFSKGAKIISKKIMLFLLTVFGLIIIQNVLYTGLTPVALYGPLRWFFTPFLLFSLLKEKYFKYLFNVLYVVAIYTTILFFLQASIPSVQSMLERLAELMHAPSFGTNEENIIFYTIITFPYGQGYRNAGLFHEAGAFALYSLIAIILNTLYTKNYFDKKTLILTFCILTTFSTTGYFCLFIYYGWALYKTNINVIIKLMVYSIFIVSVYFLFNSAPFLKQKVGEQYEQQMTHTKDITEEGRFSVFITGVNEFIKHPVFGKGIISETNKDLMEEHRFGWGFTNFCAQYGILGLFYMWIYYLGCLKLIRFYKLPVMFAVVIYIIIHLSLSTQMFFLHTPYVMFFIYGLYKKLPDMSLKKQQFVENDPLRSSSVIIPLKS